MLSFMFLILIVIMGYFIMYTTFKSPKSQENLPLCEGRHEWVKAVLLTHLPQDVKIESNEDLDKYEKLVCKNCGFIPTENKQLEPDYLKQITYQLKKKELNNEYQWYKEQKKNELLDKKLEELSKSSIINTIPKDELKQLLEIGMELERDISDKAADEQFYAQLEKEIRRL